MFFVASERTIELLISVLVQAVVITFVVWLYRRLRK